MKTRGSKDRRADLPAQRSKCGVRFRGEDGTALVEIAMILPVFLAFVTGIGSFGIALGNQLTLIQATTAGAQYLQESRGSTTNPCADTLTAITNASPSLASANIGLTLTMNGNAAIKATTCSGNQSQLAQGATVTVATTYPCTLSVYGIHFANSCQLSAQVTEYEY